MIGCSKCPDCKSLVTNTKQGLNLETKWIDGTMESVSGDKRKKKLTIIRKKNSTFMLNRLLILKQLKSIDYQNNKILINIQNNRTLTIKRTRTDFQLCAVNNEY